MRGRSYLHHTGGMVSFSSSFHLDVASGVGAFASSTLSAFAEYRPRLLTRFAVDALTNALAGQAAAGAAAARRAAAQRRELRRTYSGPAGASRSAPGSPLTIVADGQSARAPAVGRRHVPHHPSALPAVLADVRADEGRDHGRELGPVELLRDRVRAAQSPARIRRLRSWPAATSTTIRGSARAIVVERGGKLWLGTETPLTRIGDNLWRVGDESWSPERASFADFIDGRPQTFILSGEKFLRHEI